ncbi:hypothetical protein [Amycolatopsis methanolica]|uniref:Uncharacterized protein n=1 Tax=Amycolatopsis methanolica 239 TaxID=1068978 RepID=A0A076N0M0_AMYME|nr:hypothetical protein [Amycolatopsis methanolica]AIJ26393.1 hypothetical protein AMETH_6301 [Amycolatopsis methanolica 239]AIJ26452.1 hypothetical protein AMETH_6360 [Amycolatopsis methanolica 239]
MTTALHRLAIEPGESRAQFIDRVIARAPRPDGATLDRLRLLLPPIRRGMTERKSAA